MRILIAAAVLVAGCGPASPPANGDSDPGVADAGSQSTIDAGIQTALRVVRLEIGNNYAESLLGASAILEGGTGDSILLFDDERFAMGAMKTSPATLSVSVGGKIQWTATSMSLGQRHTFGPFADSVPDQPSPVFQMIYDYDLAKGAFVVYHGWKK